MFVKMWMTRDLITVSPEIPIMEARKLMKDSSIRRLPVVEAGKLVGIVTEGDLQEASPSDITDLNVWELSYLLAKTTVAEVMSNDVVTIEPDEAIEAVALTMRERKISGLPVVDRKQRLVGIITESDVFDALIEIMGFAEGGTRLFIELEDRPGALIEALEPMRTHNVNILSLSTAYVHTDPLTTRRVVIRMVTRDVDEIVAELERAGVKVLDVRV
ncbi:MAG: CBS and ACT domain-containing protein [Candidatus Bipolaricaulia bacterium]